MKIRIYYEDTDAGGIVYHSNYFKYCERARSEAFFSNDVPLCNENCGFIVRKIIDADFIKPAFLGDLLDVHVKMVSHKKTSFTVLHEIYRNGEKIFQTHLLAVYVCDGKPSKIPQNVFDFLLKYSVNN